MEKRIDLERRGKEPKEVKELNLDNCRSTQIEGLTTDYVSLESLSMINVGLTNLKGFPKLPELQKLELSDNRISGGLTVLQGCPKLSHLNVSGNKIKDLEALEALKTLESLTHLDLFNNPLGNEEEDYRNKVFKLLPNLKYLDGTDVENEEDEESDTEDGQNGVTHEEEDDGDGDAHEEEDDGDGDDDDDDDDEGGDEEDDSGEEEDGPGLSAIYSENLGDDEEGEDFEGDDFEGDEEVEEDEDIEEEEEEDQDQPSGKKRKTEETQEAK